MPRLKSIYDWKKIIYELRQRNDWTQEALARKLGGASVFTISKWERGTEPGPEYRAKIKEVAMEAGFPEELWPTLSQKIRIVKDTKI